MPAARALITLLTDFGTRDYFVASMKGVILSIHPEAGIIDLSHEISPQDIAGAAYLLKSCYRYFPEGTIHVAVVDPGVGTHRRPLLISTSRYFFIGPDNGLFTHVCAEDSPVEIRQIENRQYRLDAAGTTFDGRDLFAPAAAWLAQGLTPASFGRVLPTCEQLPRHKPMWKQGTLMGEVVHIDRFGNVISNVTGSELAEVRTLTKRQAPRIRIAGCSIDGLVSSYSEGAPDRPCALINSNGQLEIFVRDGDAAKLLETERGAPVELS
jgi:S-adenosylmethionine hydrolase